MVSGGTHLQRQAAHEEAASQVSHLAETRGDIRGVATVGSWARHQATLESDVDLVILTDQRDQYVSDSSWIRDAVGEDAPIVRTQAWGLSLLSAEFA